MFSDVPGVGVDPLRRGRTHETCHFFLPVHPRHLVLHQVLEPPVSRTEGRRAREGGKPRDEVEPFAKQGWGASHLARGTTISWVTGISLPGRRDYSTTGPDGPS